MHYLVCSEEPVNDVCNSTSWVELPQAVHLTSDEFLLVLPEVMTALLLALGFRWIVRIVFNTR